MENLEIQGKFPALYISYTLMDQYKHTLSHDPTLWHRKNVCVLEIDPNHLKTEIVQVKTKLLGAVLLCPTAPTTSPFLLGYNSTWFYQYFRSQLRLEPFAIRNRKIMTIYPWSDRSSFFNFILFLMRLRCRHKISAEKNLWTWVIIDQIEDQIWSCMLVNLPVLDENVHPTNLTHSESTLQKYADSIVKKYYG